MQPEIYWIKDFELGRLAIMPRPRAGDWLADEIKGLRQNGVDILVSLLTRDEIYALELTEEPSICQTHQIEFISFPIPDGHVPSSTTATFELIQSLLKQIQQGKGVAIHCRAGIGRSALIVASILVCTGINPLFAFEMVSRARGLIVPDTQEQQRWLVTFAQNRKNSPLF